MSEDISTPVKSFYCVEFPGKVVNVDRAICCLGGINKISNAFNDTTVKLECRFRPNDRFCKATVADRNPSTSFVLKVVVKRKKKRSKEDEVSFVSSSIVGKVEQVFTFCNLNDFQYLPMEKNADGVYESIYDKIVPKSVIPLSYLSEAVPSFFPPVVFSRSDSVQPYLATKVTEDAAGLIGRTRDRRSNYVKFVSHDLKEVPSTPNLNTLRYIKLKFVTEEQIFRMKELFDERPIWTKSALECFTKYSEVQLKYLLALNAYHFTSGPYRIAWVRFGYDPRKDSSSKKYQVLDYRLRNHILSIMRERQPERFSRGRTKQTQPDDPLYDPFNETHYKFMPGILPPQKQMFYQICDIEIPEVQEKLDNFSSNKGYDSKFGWLTEGFLEMVRKCIDKHVMTFVTGCTEEESNIKLALLPDESAENEPDDSGEDMEFDALEQDEFMDIEDL